MRLEISELHKRLQTTMIYVTHDQVEAMTMADKIVVLNQGVIEQVGSPLELYDAPAPEHLSLSTDSGQWQGTVGVSEHLGSDTFIRVQTDGIKEPLTIRAPGKLTLNDGSRVFVTAESDQLHRFDEHGQLLR